MSKSGPSSTVAELLWDCLNTNDLLPQGPDEDLLGLDDLKGIEIHLNRQNPHTVDFRVEELKADTVHQWLEKDSIAGTKSSDSLRLKLLVGDQAVAGDLLRPPPKAQAERFSRKQISKHFGIPPIALAKLCLKSPWVLEFPRDTRAEYNCCYGIGTSDFSLGWVLSDHDPTIRAMMTIFRGTIPSPRDVLLETLRKLGTLADLPTHLLLSMLNIAVPLTARRLGLYRTQVQKSDAAILRLSDMRAADTVFGSAHTLSSSNALTAQDARNLLALTEMLPNIPQKYHRRHAIGTRVEFQAKNRETNNLLRFCRKYLEVEIGEAMRNQESISRQLATVQQQLSIRLSRDQHELAQTARREQEISTEIAKASRDIAEETKKDGTSMKTLSVVAMLFLPATLTASVFAMPFFNWDAKHGGAIVNSRIWVYVVSASIVTAITVGSWYLWLWRGPRRKGRAQFALSSMNGHGQQTVV